MTDQGWWQDYWSWQFKAEKSNTAAGGRVASSSDGGLARSVAQQGPSSSSTPSSSSKNNSRSLASTTTSDWWGASSVFLEKALEPELMTNKSQAILQIGCGDSPLAELIWRAGFHNLLNVDVAASVVDRMRGSYPASNWPGLKFQLADLFDPRALPVHGFDVVVDKGGAWDWNKNYAGRPAAVLSAVQRLLRKSRTGRYLVATTQTPEEFDTTARLGLGGTTADSPIGFERVSAKDLGGGVWAYTLKLRGA